MDVRTLLAWGDLEARRRRAARTGLGALSPWAYSILAGVVLALLIGRAMRVFGDEFAGDSNPIGMANLWLAALAAGHVIVLLGAPFRMYWRYDSTLLGRMAIAGKPLFTVALIRSMRAAAKVSVPLALGALMFAFGPFGSMTIALRHLALVAIAFVWAGLFGPAVALGAGALVASDKARTAISNLAGEFQPPKTSWLGVLPGFAGTGLILIVVASASWSRRLDWALDKSMIVLIAGALVPIACALWALSRSDVHMVAALREVSALDQERLAHVERTGPSALERMLASVLGSRAARLIVHKDASLARRRYPIPFFLGVMGLLALWIVAAVAPDDMMLWAGTVCAGLGAYAVVMANRLVQPPIEHMRYVHTLPIGSRTLMRAKHAHVLLWVARYMVLGAVPVVIRAAEPLSSGVLMGSIVAVTAIAGVAVTARRRY